MDLRKLKAPFTAKQIHWRVGRITNANDKAIPFGYLDARDVMQRLDEVCGMGGWQVEYPFPGCCRIGIKVGTSEKPEWVWKSNGAGASDIEGDKGIFSDAFKRAAVLWGIGQYLYDLPNTNWFPINEYKQFEKNTIAELNERYEVWAEKYFSEDK